MNDAVTSGAFLNDVHYYVKAEGGDIRTFIPFFNYQICETLKRYLHRAPLTLIFPKQYALYLASNHTYVPSYPITNNEPKLKRIAVALFLSFFHFLKICC
jgi:hypothetical protein